MSARREEWVSATDLAEYAYCPRSLHYRRVAPDEPPTVAAVRGAQYHARVLGGERRRARSTAVYWAALLAGVILVVGAAMLVRP